MPIIYLKNPRSGSHFRNIGGPSAGSKGGRKTPPGTSWASCNNAFRSARRRTVFGTVDIIHPDFMTMITGTITPMLGPNRRTLIARAPRSGPSWTTFSKPCRGKQ